MAFQGRIKKLSSAKKQLPHSHKNAPKKCLPLGGSVFLSKAYSLI